MPQVLLEERFTGRALSPQLHWWNPPSDWSLTPAGTLLIRPDAKTDFWRTTHYGYDTDNGHCLFTEVSGDFVLSTTVHLRPVHRYDQAGLMVRLSRDCWLKASVEYEIDGPAMLGAVVTNHGFSDWSNQSLTADEICVSLRLRREDSACFVEYRLKPEEPWTLIRLAYLSDTAEGSVQCGLYACSPIDAGGEAEFSNLAIESGRV